MITLRPMGEEDISAGLSLCRSAGWNQQAKEWQLFLNVNSQGCRVAVDETEKVIGTVTTLRYQHRFSWIGMVLVDPGHQQQGIGMKLLHEALTVLQDEPTIKLDATPAGRAVYLKLDFVDEYPISRLQLAPVARELPSTAVPVTEKEWSQILELDQHVFGADRTALLKWMLTNAPQFAFCIKDEGNVSGYCFGRAGHHFTHIGPVVAQNYAGALNLVRKVANACAHSSIIVDVLQHTPEWRHELNALGFTEQRPLIRMYRGTNAYPGIPTKQFAILGPEFG